MTPEEKKEVAKITLKCILAFLYLCLGFHYLFEVLFPKEEEIEEEEVDNHIVMHLRPIPVDNIVQFRKREEHEHDAEGS